MTEKKRTERLSNLKRAIFFGLGLALALGQAPFHLSFFNFLALPFLAYCLRNAPNPKIGFGIGWWTALGYFGLSLSWIVEPFFVSPDVPIILAPFSLFAMAGGLSLFWGSAFGLAARTFGMGANRVIALALFWTLFEFLRANVLTGFPWGHLTYSFANLPFIQLVSVFGIHGSGLVFLLACFLPAITAPKMWDGAVYTAIIFGVIGSFGVWRSSGESEVSPSDKVVRILQPNAPQHLKWRNDMRDVFFNRSVGYTAARTPRAPDVVVWPETSIPYLYDQDLPAIQQIADAAGDNTSVIAGVIRRQDGKAFNSLVYIDPKGGITNVFDKHHLVPFGEYFPFPNLSGKLGLGGLADLVGNFKAGSGPATVEGHSLPDFVALICYEAIFPSYSFGGSTRAEWIVHITNDAWFGTFSGPYQHLIQARVRAIEQGLPLARSANTGVSAMIDPYGKVVGSLALGESGYIDIKLPAHLNYTVYSWMGNWPAIMLWIVFMSLIVLFRAPEDS